MAVDREADARIVAHAQHLAALARTIADSEVVSFRRRAPTRAELAETARDPAAPPAEAFEQMRDRAGNEAEYLRWLLRTYPTAQAMRDGGRTG